MEKNLLKTRIKTKKKHHILEFNQSQWLKQYIEFKTQKRIKAEKNTDKDGKVFVQINEQCCIPQNNLKLEKKKRCKVSKQMKKAI